MATKIPATPPAETKKARAPKTAAVGKAAKIPKAEKPLTPSQKLDKIGIEAICERIESGDSQAEIADDINVSTGTLSGWLNNEDNNERSARAREASAEAWLDRGIKPLKDGLMKDSGIDASAARAYEQACARRASIRNPKYRDKVDISADITTSQLTDEQLLAKAATLQAKIGLLPQK